MARMKWGPKSNTRHRHVRPPNIDLGERPCPECGRSIRIVLWHGGGKPTPAERYELDGKRHQCAGQSKGESSPYASRCRRHSPKLPKAKRPAPVEAVYSKLRRQRRPGGTNTISYKECVRRLLALAEPVLNAAGLYGETRELARSCVLQWCLQYYSLRGRHLADRVIYTFDRFRDKGIDPKVLEKVLLTVDKELGPPF